MYPIHTPVTLFIEEYEYVCADGLWRFGRPARIILPNRFHAAALGIPLGHGWKKYTLWPVTEIQKSLYWLLCALESGPEIETEPFVWDIQQGPKV